MTRTFSDIDGTPHLVENRFRLNGAPHASRWPR
jgi:hypothetical protein